MSGSSSGITVSNPIDIAGGNEWTIELWFKKTLAGTGYQNLISSISSFQYDSSYFCVANGKIQIWDKGKGVWYASVTPIADNTWYHVALTSSSTGKILLYINGVLDNGISYTPTTLSNSGLTVGTIGSANTNGRYFGGIIDELRVWNVARNQTEISDSMHSKLSPKYSANIVSLFTMDEGAGTPTDLISTTRTTTALGMSWVDGEIDLYSLNIKILFSTPSGYKKFDSVSSIWRLVTTIEPTEQQYLNNGMNMVDVMNIPVSSMKELGEKTTISIYTAEVDKEYAELHLTVEPYSVYDYISELPEVLVYTESTDDIIVSTTTEPFDIYDEFGDSVEVLYYTDDPEVTNADLILEANWSPLDELEGDFEVVTWTDEAPETAQRVLEMKAIPKPQLIKLVNPKRIYGALDEVLVNDLSQSYRDEARYFISGTDTSKWYVWNKVLKKFVIADASSEEAIIANGMKHTDLNNITDTEWRTWNEQFLNIGIFLKDNPRDTIVSVVENVSYEDYLPRHTSTIQDTSLYILNTTAKIDIAFNGNVLKGMLSDDDLTRVQYRVILNNRYYYPADGSFTQLGESPQNIELVIRSKDIKIDDWNTLKVEFQDSFGTTDYWSTNFMGTYTGLMFKDVYGEYFSNEIGEVLKYLDFGVIIAGQTTIEHEVFLKNQYGYDVKNVHLLANTTNFPSDMTVEFSQSNSPFTPHSDLKLSGMLANNAETSFFIRLKTKLGSTPDANGSFDIIVRADKA
ncbi:LamG domain-containing protein [Lysinibacillus sphaericus]|uniref:LamG domain-containing protein n=1 Tax=Lysinibacillus sphaericus TaxID=1421 RepID=UPI0038261A0D